MRSSLFCKKYGADVLFNYAKDDLKEGLKKIGGAKGIDIVFDPVGTSCSS